VATSNFAYDKGIIMKSTLLIAMLLTLVACNSEKKSSFSCTYNGGPCPSETAQYTENKEVVVVAQVISAINVDGHQIEIVENTYDYQEKTENGRIYTCENSTDAGIQATYKIEKDQLTILYDVQTDEGIKTQMDTFTRYQGFGKKLTGTWMGQKQIDKDLYETTFLIFGDKSMKTIVECHHQL
jgi:hypothetical protein